MPAAAVAPASASSLTGVVVSLRPLEAGAHEAALGALGGRPQAGAPDRVEIVIRLADGQTVALVQSNEQRLRPGERVAVAPGPRRVARVGE